MLSKKVVDVLKEKNMSISTMESCTGGYAINCITNEEGSSSVTEGGFVTYSNNQKVRMGVDKNCIETYGVYSKETAISMANAVYDNMKTNVSIGITGTLSNIDPNNNDSVQGKVFYCIMVRLNDETSYLNFELNVPIINRQKQKDFICEDIFKNILNIINQSIS